MEKYGWAYMKTTPLCNEYKDSVSTRVVVYHDWHGKPRQDETMPSNGPVGAIQEGNQRTPSNASSGGGESRSSKGKVGYYCTNFKLIVGPRVMR